MTKLTTDDLAHLAAPARDYLLLADAERVTGDQGTREQLEALLKERELPVYDVLFTIEEALGGIELPDPSGSTALGAYGLLKNQLPESRPGWARFEYEGETLVWVAATSATVMYALPDGRIVEVDFYGGGACVVASDLEHRLGHELIATRTDEAGLEEGDSFEGAVGEIIAKALGVPLDEAVSDGHRRWWHDELWSIDEGSYPATGTTETIVYGTTEEQLDKVRKLLEG